jgi:hypothetical protein
MSPPSSGTNPAPSKPEEPCEGSRNREEEPWPEPGADDDQKRSEDAPRSDTKGSHTDLKPQRHYPPRTCRICLETILPTFEPPREGIAAMLDPTPKVSYISSDPQAGRLIRPCKCSGSSRYVHEGCLQAWRHADRKYSRRNYWECPTCGFRYKLERMRWARWISSTITQVLLTFVIMIAAIFVFGFIADPIITVFLGDLDPLGEIPEEMQEIYDAPWTIHFIKGIASIGVLGFIRVVALPSFIFNIRPTIPVRIGGRRGRRGRYDVQDITLVLIFTGVITIMMVGCKSCHIVTVLTNSYRLSGIGFGFGVVEGSRELENVLLTSREKTMILKKNQLSKRQLHRFQ